MYAVTNLVRLCSPRKRLAILGVIAIGVLGTFGILGSTQTHLSREDIIQGRLVHIEMNLQFLESLYRARRADILALQEKLDHGKFNISHATTNIPITISPELAVLIKNMHGMKAATAIQNGRTPAIRMPVVYQLMPHLMDDSLSLKPAFLLKGGRTFVDVVIGIPTVKRDKESYLMITLSHLVNGLDEEDYNSTLIVIYVGDTDLHYVTNTARQIEAMFPKEIKSGLIEIIAPSPSYYPNLDNLKPTLGDPMKRVKWRTKQNLDTMYLMTYAQPKGAFYLMLEDDIIAKKHYLQEIKHYITLVSVSNPHWIMLEFCRVGGIGKLFRSTNLIHLVTYIELFYNNMPIDWLIESYITDKVCTIEKTAKQCAKNRLLVRPRYNGSLFQHIGLYSSLKGKIQKIKDDHFGKVPLFYSHKNPIAESIHTDIQPYLGHTLQGAYEGISFFWGMKPKKDDVAEIWFKQPLLLGKYLFRSGNVEHVSDKFYNTAVEVLPTSNNGSFVQIGEFDEFGLAEGELKKSFGLVSAVRLRVRESSTYWVILSEIVLTPYGKRKT